MSCNSWSDLWLLRVAGCSCEIRSGQKMELLCIIWANTQILCSDARCYLRLLPSLGCSILELYILYSRFCCVSQLKYSVYWWLIILFHKCRIVVHNWGRTTNGGYFNNSNGNMVQHNIVCNLYISRSGLPNSCTMEWSCWLAIQTWNTHIF